jgi:hypothetical protein
MDDYERILVRSGKFQLVYANEDAKSMLGYRKANDETTRMDGVSGNPRVVLVLALALPPGSGWRAGRSRVCISLSRRAWCL